MIAKSYLSQVRRHLTCSTVSRRRLLDQGRQMVEDFLQETPDADSLALTAAFGEPRQFAAQMLATLEPKEVDSARRRSKSFKQGAIALVALAFVLIALFAVRRCQKYESIIPDGEYGVIQPARELTEEEFNAMVQAAQEQKGE